MITPFVRSWRALGLRATLALLCGAAMLLSTAQPLEALVVIFGTYTLLDGIVAIVMAAHSGAWEHAWLVVLEGLAGVGLGLAAFQWTRVAAELMVVAIALWAMATGVLEVAVALRLRDQPPGELPLGVAGIASAVLGFALLYWPTKGAAVAALLGSYALVFGASMLSQALRVRGKQTRPLGRGPRPFDPRPREADGNAA